MKITVMGGTGYAGEAIVREAISRGHVVASFSRSLPQAPVTGVQYSMGNALVTADLTKSSQNSEVIVAALSPRGELHGNIGTIYAELATIANETGARFMVVGGFSTLRSATDKPSFIDAGEVPTAYAAEARELADVFAWLKTNAPSSLDWIYMSPAAEFSAYNPGTPQGKYRTAGEVAIFDTDGRSTLSGADFALAVVNEIERPTLHNSIISFAY